MTEDTIAITISGKANVDWIRSKVGGEEFQTEADVVTQSIAMLREEDAMYKQWLVEVVGLRYDRHKADPSSAIAYDQAMKILRSAATNAPA